MKKRILSVLLAALMSMSALAACDNGGEPVDDVENSDGQQVVQGDIPEDPKPEDCSEYGFEFGKRTFGGGNS